MAAGEVATSFARAQQKELIIILQKLIYTRKKYKSEGSEMEEMCVEKV